MNKDIVFTTSSYYENNSPQFETFSTTGFERSISKRYEITFTRTFGFSVSGDVGIKIPIINWIIGASINFDASFSECVSVTKEVTENETVTAPPQPINVGPYSKVKVTYNVYQYIAILNYYLDFEVVPHAKDLFAFFLKKIGNAKYGQGDLKLEYLNETPIMRNFFEIEKLPSLGIDVIIHPEEKFQQTSMNMENENIEVMQIL